MIDEKKIAEVINSPEMAMLKVEHKRMLDQILRVVGQQTDIFIKDCTKKVFPSFVSDFVEKFGTHPPVSAVMKQLTEEAAFSVEEAPFFPEAQARIRTIFVGPERHMVGQLTITMQNSQLKAEKKLNEKLVPVGTTYFGVDHPVIRRFLWRLCQVGNETKCAQSAQNRYRLFYGCDPEPTAEEIKYGSDGFSTSQDPSGGVEQRSPDGGRRW